jgi:hypothetical protein
VLTDDLNDGLPVLMRDLPQFQRWQRHEEDSSFFVDEFSAKQHKGSLKWEATVRYVDTIIKNPLDEPAKLVGIRTETLPGATIANRKGQLVMNTAFDPVQPIDKPERIKVFIFEKNVADLQEWLYDLEDVCNSEAVPINGKPRPPRSLLLRKVEFGRQQAVEDITFYPCTIELAFRKSLWNHRYVSVGFNELVEIDERGPDGLPTGNKLRRKQAIQINGQAPTEPQLLDADGRWIEHPEPDQLVFLTEEIYDQADLNRLPLK